MLSPITLDTYKELVFDAGILLHDFDYSSAEDAEALAQLIKSEEVQENSWFGATKGGINPQENRSSWSPEFDYAGRMPFKGSRRFAGAEPKITGTLVQIKPKNVKLASGAAKISGEDGNVVTVQPVTDIPKDAYMSNVVWVGCLGEDGYYLVELKNAICTSGINFQSGDKNIGAIPFEFVGNADSPIHTDELPIRYLFFKASGTSDASQSEPDEISEPDESSEPTE